MLAGWCVRGLGLRWGFSVPTAALFVSLYHALYGSLAHALLPLWFPAPPHSPNLPLPCAGGSATWHTSSEVGGWSGGTGVGGGSVAGAACRSLAPTSKTRCGFCRCRYRVAASSFAHVTYYTTNTPLLLLSP